MSRRVPELDRPVYALGHYEQMVVHKALANEAHPYNPHPLTAEEQEALRWLVHIFAGHGTVTILRHEAES